MRKSILACFMFILSQSLSAQNDTFKLCGDQKTYPYYNPDLKYQGGFYEIKSHLLNSLVPNKLDKKINGIITIQFQINCEGRTGNFKVLQVDLDYNETIFEEKSIDHLLDLVKDLKNWVPAKTESGEIVNSHKFITFQIIAGEITEILPK